jgi:shikimate dehydrogenase
MRAAVLGSPVAHSLSPALHRAAYAELGLDDWTYQAIECDEAGLPAVLGSLDDGWAGLSLTMPLKRAVIGMLDWTDPLAAEVGAANTVVFGDAGTNGRRRPQAARGTSRGASRGYNTDVGGIVDALAASSPRGTADGTAVTPATALIIGGGATACSALAALGAIGIRKVTAAVRAAGRAGELLAAADRLGIAVDLAGVDGFGGPGGEPGFAELIVSTVPSGAADQLAERLPRLSPPPTAVLDVVYDPWPTRLAVAAREIGAVVIGGFELLLHQAVRQVRLMTGMEPPIEAMRAAGLTALAARAS